MMRIKEEEGKRGESSLHDVVLSEELSVGTASTSTAANEDLLHDSFSAEQRMMLDEMDDMAHTTNERVMLVSHSDLNLLDHEDALNTSMPMLLSEEEDATQNLLRQGYGNPVSKEVASKRMDQSSDKKGLLWVALILPDDYHSNEAVRHEIKAKDLDPVTHAIRPQRPNLPVAMSDFRSSLVQTDNGDWVFSGILNGWPALRTLRVVSLEHKRTRGSIATPQELIKGQVGWVMDWKSADASKKSLEDVWDEGRIYRAKLCGPAWTSIGWSPSSPGFVYWFEWHQSRLSYGTNMLQTVDAESNVTMVHMISHRYAIAKETTRDRITYHSIVLLEWDHGKYCTVVEGAYLNGYSGYKGKCNWYHDKNAAGGSRLYHSFPPESIAPWFTKSAEIRCLDVEAKNLQEFQDFIEKYKGPSQRFVDPHISFSHQARLSYRSKRNISQYLLNYIGRDTTYSDLKRNCQTLAADLCCFLCGKKSVEPFHPVSRIEYRNKTHMFLYEPSMFLTKQEKKNKQYQQKK